ncbi:MAG: hypothetical protein AAF555_11135 [Verrucomicrobiota bacterium]
MRIKTALQTLVVASAILLPATSQARPCDASGNLVFELARQAERLQHVARHQLNYGCPVTRQRAAQIRKTAHHYAVAACALRDQYRKAPNLALHCGAVDRLNQCAHGFTCAVRGLSHQPALLGQLRRTQAVRASMNRAYVASKHHHEQFRHTGGGYAFHQPSFARFARH